MRWWPCPRFPHTVAGLHCLFDRLSEASQNFYVRISIPKAEVMTRSLRPLPFVESNSRHLINSGIWVPPCAAISRLMLRSTKDRLCLNHNGQAKREKLGQQQPSHPQKNSSLLYQCFVLTPVHFQDLNNLYVTGKTLNFFRLHYEVYGNPLAAQSGQLLSASQTWASEGVCRGSMCPTDFEIWYFPINFLVEKCFSLGFKLEKWNFSTVSPPLEKYFWPPPVKIHHWPQGRN